MARKWWTLAGACAGLFLLMLDSTVVALALTSIRRDVGATQAAHNQQAEQAKLPSRD